MLAASDGGVDDAPPTWTSFTRAAPPALTAAVVATDDSSKRTEWRGVADLRPAASEDADDDRECTVES